MSVSMSNVDNLPDYYDPHAYRAYWLEVSEDSTPLIDHSKRPQIFHVMVSTKNEGKKTKQSIGLLSKAFGFSVDMAEQYIDTINEIGPIILKSSSLEVCKTYKGMFEEKRCDNDVLDCHVVRFN